MKLSKIALAIGAMTAAGAAFASPADSRIALSAGASAVRGNQVTALTTLCTNGGGQLTTFVSSNGNITAYACSTVAGLTAGPGGTYVSTPDANYRNFAGTGFAVLKLNVDQGSFSAAQILNGECIVQYEPQSNALTTCPGGTPVGTIVGGFSDVEFEAYPSDVRGSRVVQQAPAGPGQVFGVAASIPLYNAMYAEQLSSGGATVADPIPSSCGADPAAVTANLACIPTISKGQFATIANSAEFNPAKNLGARFLAPSLTGATRLNYIRRVDTSGTQAAAQNYFLGLPCSTVPLGVIPEPTSAIAPPEVLRFDDYTNLRVYAAGATGDLRTELNLAANRDGSGPAYSIGVLSGENNQTGQSWRWLRVQGAAIGENATPASGGITNRATALNGQYDFFVELYRFFNAEGNTFLTAVSNGINAVTPPIGLIRAADLSGGYTRAGNTCRPVSNANTGS